MQIGFIGLGHMGKALAGNLLKAGHRLTVWNRSPEAAEELRAQGAAVAREPAEAFAGEVAISMLADDAATRAVILDSGALVAARPGLVHLGMATLSTDFVGELLERHRHHGIAYVAAPVFGRPDVAAAGQLNILAAGPAEAVARVQPLLDVLGGRTWPLGEDPLHAAAVKIAGNFMIASAIEAMGESAALAQGFGVEPGRLLEILTGTLFACPVYRNYGGMIAERRYEPAAFRLRLGLKDVGLALSAGQSRQVPLPFASVLRDNLLEAMAHGEGERDWTALADVARRRAGQD